MSVDRWAGKGDIVYVNMHIHIHVCVCIHMHIHVPCLYMNITQP